MQHRVQKFMGLEAIPPNSGTLKPRKNIWSVVLPRLCMLHYDDLHPPMLEGFQSSWKRIGATPSRATFELLSFDTELFVSSTEKFSAEALQNISRRTLCDKVLQLSLPRQRVESICIPDVIGRGLQHVERHRMKGLLVVASVSKLRHGKLPVASASAKLEEARVTDCRLHVVVCTTSELQNSIEQQLRNIGLCDNEYCIVHGNRTDDAALLKQAFSSLQLPTAA